MPAEQKSRPSSVISWLSCKCTFGYMLRNTGAMPQWVVAFLPSSKPVAGSAKAPVQTEDKKPP